MVLPSKLMFPPTIAYIVHPFSKIHPLCRVYIVKDLEPCLAHKLIKTLLTDYAAAGRLLTADGVMKLSTWEPEVRQQRGRIRGKWDKKIRGEREGSTEFSSSSWHSDLLQPLREILPTCLIRHVASPYLREKSSKGTLILLHEKVPSSENLSPF